MIQQIILDCISNVLMLALAIWIVCMVLAFLLWLKRR